jgi:hypothetical protein
MDGLVRRAWGTLRTDGPGAVARKGYHRLLTKWYDRHAENVFEREWEVLLVLDGCRVDALAAVADEYSFLETEVPSMVSVAGSSPGWLWETFTSSHRQRVGETAYLTANPHTRRVLGPDSEGLFADFGTGRDWLADLADVVLIWEQAWDESRGTVPARAVTDRLVDAVRTASADRYVAHYMQPHFPSIPDPVGARMDVDDDARWENNVWERLAAGEIDSDRVWDAYLANLRYVLDDVEVVLSNVNSDNVVITADHGNAFGERGTFGHGADYVDAVRRVPWVRTRATDEHSYNPDVSETEVDASVTDQLAALGYR